MVTEAGLGRSGSPEIPAPLKLEIFQGLNPSLLLPVRIKNLSARGVVLATLEPPPGLEGDDLAGRECRIHLPQGEIREIGANLLWLRNPGPEGREVEFGLELLSSHLNVRRALEEHLQNYPEDLKTLWDHWDAVHADYEGPAPASEARADGLFRPSWSRALSPLGAGEGKEAREASGSDQAVYLVGFAAVAAGSAIYYLGPEAYRLFGVILAIYGSLAIAGKSMWSLLSRGSRSHG